MLFRSDIVRKFIRDFRSSGTIVMVDPVMGDHGKPYKTYTSEMCARMADLAADADIITPNLTEASMLLGRKFEEAPKTREAAFEWLRALSKNESRSVVLTGVSPAEGEIGSAYFDSSEREYGLILKPFVGYEYHGTGDIYSSVLLGWLLRGVPLKEAVGKAAEFVLECAKLTYEEKTPAHEGVRFEALMGRLV